jgi:hypothetical protein
MKRWTAVAVLIGIFWSLTSAAHAYIETFDANYAGWRTYTIDNSGALPSGTHAVFNSSPGNPGGYIYGSVPNGTDAYNTRLYSFEVSGAGFGSLLGQTLAVDYRSTGTVNGPSGADVRFYLTDGTNFFVSSSLGGPNTGGNWTTLMLAVNAGKFTQVGLSTVDFATLAASPGEIGLIFGNGDFSSNAYVGFSSPDGATISIDNFGVPGASPVPIPAACWLLGSGLMGLMGIKEAARRRDSFKGSHEDLLSTV